MHIRQTQVGSYHASLDLLYDTKRRRYVENKLSKNTTFDSHLETPKFGDPT